MITVASIQSRCLSALDAEGFDRYTFDRDFLYAINYAKDFVVSIFNSVFGENKLNEECLQELVNVSCFTTSSHSRIVLDNTELGKTIWSILAIYPEITYSGTPIAQTSLEQSLYQSDLSYLKSYYSAGRVTHEEINESRDNPFAKGNEIITTDKLKTYAYINHTNYTGGYSLSTTTKHELELVPAVNNGIVGVAYLKYPTDIATINDSIEFPPILMNMIVDKVLQFIAYKQGDNTTLMGITKQDSTNLIQLMA